MPGLGVIDWPSFLINLMHFGYDGVFMTEVKTGTAAEVVNAYKNVICK
jgi:sugar phosphate isomerase/epimerase